MFEQFRRYFPQGCLISELVQIDHGKYIVRASVQNEGLTLATGLAAADTVEKAEDQARNRALAVLDIALTSAQPKERTSQGTTVSASTSPKTTATSQHQEESKSSPMPASSETSNASQFAMESEPELTFSQTEMETEPVTKQSTSQGNNASSTEEKTFFDDKPPAPPDTEVSSSSSNDEETTMDYSDIIARTNVELKRLQWTNEQGRKFLEETYGKRSRSLLSESELLEFLQYLEKQPTPPQNS